jgi:hypothetical protein
MVALAIAVGSAAAAAEPSVSEAKSVYNRLIDAADGLQKAGKDCGKAAKPLADGMEAWSKAHELGVDKGDWWKKAKLGMMDKAEIELLFRTSYVKFIGAVGDEGKRCGSDPNFKEAQKTVSGKNKS